VNEISTLIKTGQINEKTFNKKPAYKAILFLAFRDRGREIEGSPILATRVDRTGKKLGVAASATQLAYGK